MKFKFCGGLDCPDWLLAGIAELSNVSTIKLKEISQKATKLMVDPTKTGDIIKELTNDLSMSSESISSMLSVVAWIMKGSAANSLDHSSLQSELLQLGTPREHAGAISRVYRDHCAVLMQEAKKNSLRLSHLVSVDGSVLYLTESKNIEDESLMEKSDNTDLKWRDYAQLDVEIQSKEDGKVMRKVLLSYERLAILIHELEVASSVIEKLQD